MAKFVMPVITILALFVWGFLILHSMHMVNRGGPLSQCIEEGFSKSDLYPCVVEKNAR
jgi:hypothetical protein